MINNNFAALYAMGMFRGGIGFGGSSEDDRGQPGMWVYIIWIIASIVFFSTIWGNFRYWSYMGEENTYAGTAELKWKDPCYHKGKFTYNLWYMQVQFDSIPVKAYLLVTENTYNSTRKGDRVSFVLSNEKVMSYCYPKKFNRTFWLVLILVFYPIGYLVCFCGFAIPLIKYVLKKDSWLYKHENSSA